MSTHGDPPPIGGRRPTATARATAQGLHLMDARPTLGDVLSAAIQASGRSLAETALMLGTSRANVVQWCGDQCDPWPENFDALTEYLGIDLDELGRLVIRAKVRRAGSGGHDAGGHPSGQRPAI